MDDTQNQEPAEVEFELVDETGADREIEIDGLVYEVPNGGTIKVPAALGKRMVKQPAVWREVRTKSTKSKPSEVTE